MAKTQNISAQAGFLFILLKRLTANHLTMWGQNPSRLGIGFLNNGSHKLGARFKIRPAYKLVQKQVAILPKEPKRIVIQEQLSIWKRRYSNVTRTLILQAVAEKEGIEAQESDFQAYFGSGRTVAAENYGKGYTAQLALEYSVGRLLQENVVLN